MLSTFGGHPEYTGSIVILTLPEFRRTKGAEEDLVIS